MSSQFAWSLLDAVADPYEERDYKKADARTRQNPLLVKIQTGKVSIDLGSRIVCQIVSRSLAHIASLSCVSHCAAQGHYLQSASEAVQSCHDTALVRLSRH
jgi:hypothetical protein